MEAKRLPNKLFNYIYSQVPRFCVELVVKRNDKFLLVKRAIPPGIGKWYLPGGTVLFNESIKEAAERVAKEELSIEIKKMVITSKLIEWKETENVNGHAISLLIDVYDWKGKIKLDRQASEYTFVKEGEYIGKFPIEYGRYGEKLL